MHAVQSVQYQYRARDFNDHFIFKESRLSLISHTFIFNVYTIYTSSFERAINKILRFTVKHTKKLIV